MGIYHHFCVTIFVLYSWLWLLVFITSASLGECSADPAETGAMLARWFRFSVDQEITCNLLGGNAKVLSHCDPSGALDNCNISSQYFLFFLDIMIINFDNCLFSTNSHRN